MAAPSDKGSSVFAASQTALVQLTTAGNLYAIAFSPDNDSTNAQATWEKIALPKLNFLQEQSQNTTGTSTATTTRTSGSTSPTSEKGGARRTLLSWGMAVAGLALGAVGLAL